MTSPPDPGRVEKLFHAASGLPPDECRQYLDKHCHDPQERQRVERLLAVKVPVPFEPPAGGPGGPEGEEPPALPGGRRRAAVPNAATADHSPVPATTEAPAIRGSLDRRVSEVVCTRCGKSLSFGKPVRVDKVKFCISCGQRLTVSLLDPAAPPGSGPPEVPGYTILAELGRGGMGVVYRARDERLKRVVALKMLAQAPDRVAQERFHAEAEAIARLHHPHIVQVYEVGEHHGRLYLAMEYVGGTLINRLEAGLVPARAAARLTEVLARAVHAAHQRGIVHRDLKPANLLLAPADATTGETGEVDPELLDCFAGVPKIADFGLAMRLDRDDASDQPGEVVGTPLYMAPEQARGRTAQIGPATDVYALGAILYECLTGRPPFRAETRLETLRQVASDQPVPPRKLRPGLSPDLEAICLKCLQKDPLGRYRSAQALADDLHCYLAGEPVRARPAGPLGRAWRWSVRNPTPASLLLTTLAVVLLGFPGVLYLSELEAKQAAVESAEQQAKIVRDVWALYGDSVNHARKVVEKRDPKSKLFEPGVGFDLTHSTEKERHGALIARTDPPDSIPYPATFVILLGERSKLTRNRETDPGPVTGLRVYSRYPFRKRTGKRTESPPDGEDKFALKALALFEDTDQKCYHKPERRDDGWILRYAIPLRLERSCLNCHNNPELYSEEQGRRKAIAKEWKVGDVRGVLEIVRPMSHDHGDIWWTHTGAYAAMVGAAGVLLALGRLVLHWGKPR